MINAEIKAIGTQLTSLESSLEKSFASNCLGPDQSVKSLELRNLLKERSRQVDKTIKRLWVLNALDKESNLTLCAVGGYGRRELFPKSDIDIVFLHTNKLSPQQATKIESLIQQLWDFGLSVGQSIRDISTCLEDCRSDHTILTNLLTSRALCGDRRHHRSLKKMLINECPIPKHDFFHLKQQEYNQRHLKHADTEYNLEPNVKAAPGGLRDVHTISWISQYTLGANSLRQLLTRSIVHREELARLKEGYDFISASRFALHLITQRDENRLLFDYQKQVAEMLGFTDSNANQAVENFMKTFYRHASMIASLVDILIENIEEEMISLDGPSSIKPLNSRFDVIDSKIAVNCPSVFKEQPSSLLEIFYLLGQEPNFKGIRAATIRLLRSNRMLINEDFRSNPRNNALFLKILRSPYRLFAHLRLMKRYGILGRYLPEFGDVIGQMQYDLFHIYTVDAHALFTVQNMRLLRHAVSRDNFPLAAQLIHDIPDRTLLYIAGLFHDIAKGRHGDHSILGAQDVAKFCRRHQLSDTDTELVEWLVHDHLIMSVTAQKTDIGDHRVIQNFATKVRTQERLDYLYLLTICDIGATNPKLLNPWRLSLLNQLYIETKQTLKRGIDVTDTNSGRVNRMQDIAANYLRAKGIFKHQFHTLWQEFGTSYFLRNSAADIAWHTEAILKEKKFGQPLVIVGLTQDSPAQVYTQIFIYTADKPNLFATTVRTLTDLQLNILDARVLTSASGYTLNTFIVDDDNTGIIANTPQIFRSIRQQLSEAILDSNRVIVQSKHPIPRRYKHFQIPLVVEFSSILREHETLVRIELLDRPGLLAEIGVLFAQRKINIHAAKILTFGEKAEDYFYVTNENNQVLTEAECRALQADIEKLFA